MVFIVSKASKAVRKLLYFCPLNDTCTVVSVAHLHYVNMLPVLMPFSGSLRVAVDDWLAP